MCASKCLVLSMTAQLSLRSPELLAYITKARQMIMCWESSKASNTYCFCIPPDVTATQIEMSLKNQLFSFGSFVLNHHQCYPVTRLSAGKDYE